MKNVCEVCKQIVKVELKDKVEGLYEPIRMSVYRGLNSEPYSWGYKQAILDFLKLLNEI